MSAKTGPKVLFTGGGTGGHLMPALALAEALVQLRPDVEPVFVGAERGIEASVLPRYPYRHRLLPIEPIHRRAWWRNVRWPLVLWRVWRGVGEVLAAEHPALVVGTGGYAAGPIVWRAQRSGLATVIQEQNAFPGLTTRWLARRARQIYLGFGEARQRISPGSRTEVFTLGNPVRPPVAGDRVTALEQFGLDPRRITVLVFGGSQGARALNFAVAGAVEHGFWPEANLLWGVGPDHANELARFSRPGRIEVRGFFDPIAAAYQAADLVVCRAGAMTTAELCAWGKASILVPLPSAAADHQTYNARALAEAGAAALLPESELTPQSLAKMIATLVTETARRTALATAAKGRGHPNAAREIVSKMLTLLA